MDLWSALGTIACKPQQALVNWLFPNDDVEPVGASRAGQGSRSPDDRVPTPNANHPKDLGVPDATAVAPFACPDLTMFCRLDELDLIVTGQRLEPDRASLAGRVLEPDQWCHRCGCEGLPRDTVVRQLVHEPFGWRPTKLLRPVPLPLQRVRTPVAPRQQQGRRTTSQAVPRRTAVGTGRARGSAPHRRPGRRRARSRVGHRRPAPAVSGCGSCGPGDVSRAGRCSAP